MADEPNIHMPKTLGELGPTIRAPWYPTIPRQSTNPGAWSIIRVYSCGISAADAVAYNTDSIQRVRFSLPCTLLSWSAGVAMSDGSGFPAFMNPLDSFKIQLETENGERITTNSRRAGSVLGDGKHIGHVGGSGWPFSVGSNLVCTITPALANLPQGVYLEIDLSFNVLETRIGSSVQALQVAGLVVGQV